MAGVSTERSAELVVRAGGGVFLYPSLTTRASFEGAPLTSGDFIFARVWSLPAASWTGDVATTIPDFADPGLRYVDSKFRRVTDRNTIPPSPPQMFVGPTDNIFGQDRTANALPVPEPSAGLLGLLGAGLAASRSCRCRARATGRAV